MSCKRLQLCLRKLALAPHPAIENPRSPQLGRHYRLPHCPPTFLDTCAAFAHSRIGLCLHPPPPEGMPANASFPRTTIRRSAVFTLSPPPTATPTSLGALPPLPFSALARSRLRWCGISALAARGVCEMRIDDSLSRKVAQDPIADGLALKGTSGSAHQLGQRSILLLRMPRHVCNWSTQPTKATTRKPMSGPS